MEENKKSTSKTKVLSSLIIVAVLLLSTLAMVPMVTGAGPVIVSIAPSTLNTRVGNTYKLAIKVNPNGTAIDTFQADYIYWSTGKMELLEITRGNLLPEVTTQVGWVNYSSLPSPPTPATSKTWNYTLTTNLENCNATMTTIKMSNEYAWGGSLNATLTVNGAVIGNYSIAEGGSGWATVTTSLSDWISAGSKVNVQYINITIKNWGPNTMAKTQLSMRDLNHRFLVWGSTTPMGGSSTYYYANLTFKAFQAGDCTFTVDTSKVKAVRSGSEKAFTFSPNTAVVHIFNYYYPENISSFTATTYNRTRIDLAWTSGYWTNTVVVRGKLGSAPTSPTDGVAVYNGTGASVQHTGLYPGDHWYYKAWGYNTTDHVFSQAPKAADDTTTGNGAPVFSNEKPTDNTGNIDKTRATVNVTINDAEADQMSWTIHGTYVTLASGTSGNGNIQANLITPLPYNTNIIWYVNATDGFIYTNATYNFTVRNEYQPGEPGSFSATTKNRTQIDLAFTRGTGADKTRIEWNDHASWAVGTGNYLYNSTGTTYNHQNLNDGTRYYYQAWGWNNTDAVYSTLNMSDDDITIDNLASTLSGETPADNTPNVGKTQATVSVIIHDADLDSMSWTIHGPYITTATGTDGDGDDISATFNVPVLPYNTNIIWYVNVTDGFDWTNATYNFTVRAEYAPSGATGFTATPYSTTQVNLTWTKGASHAERTYIEWKSTATWARGAGTEIYNGTGTNFEQTGRNPHTTYYYQVWSWNETDKVYSSSYETANALTLNTVPTKPTSEHPHNNTAYMSVYNAIMNLTATDGDSDNIKMEFYWGNGTAIAFTTVGTGLVAQISLPDYITPDWLAHDTTYTWYAIANDQFGGTNRSATYNFHTSKAWDIDEDTDVDGADVSGLVSHYGDTLVAGSLGWDIYEDGHVNGVDVSGLVSHYGDSY